MTPAPRPLRGQAAGRLLVQLAVAGCGFGIALMTARWLGPEGKGVFSTATSLVSIVAATGALGLGGASVILAGQGRLELARGSENAIALAAVASIVLTPIAYLLLVVIVGADDVEAIVLAAAALPALLYGVVITDFVAGSERFVESSLVALVSAVAKLVLLPVALGLLALGVAGALGTVLAASLLALGFGGWRMRAAGLGLRPRLSRAVSKEQMRYGLPLQGAALINGLVARLDLILVFAIAGEAAAGSYSVALTVSAYVALAPAAVGYVTFPRLAHSAEDSWQDLFLASCRLTIAVGLIWAVLALAAVPLIPALFGEGFRSAVVPAAILAVAGVVTATQMMVTRGPTARGDVSNQLFSFGTTLVTMVALDLVLIPPFEIAGAAVAFLLASGLGLAVGLSRLARVAGAPVLSPAMLPGRADFAALLILARDMARRARR